MSHPYKNADFRTHEPGEPALDENIFLIRGLLAAVLRQAVDDLRYNRPGRKADPNVVLEWYNNKKSAIAFLLSEDGAAVMSFLGLNRKRVLQAVRLEENPVAKPNL